MKITKMEVIHVKPRYSFLKIVTDEGITGIGEACLEGRARVVEMAIQDFEYMLLGQDPRNIEHLWNLMYRGTFYRAGAIMCSAISAIDQALWDILGKSLNVPVYKLLGGAVRDKIRVYKHVNTDEKVTTDDMERFIGLAKKAVQEGYTMIKTALPGPAHILETKGFIDRQVQRVAALREAIGPDVDFGIDFHGRVSPALAMQLIKEFEPFKPMFIEEPCLPENVDTMVTIARSTTIPIATGERLYTRWGFKDVLEKQAAAILQPDLAHCGGITEAKKIAAMGEVYYTGFAPHNPLGPVNLAASIQLSATVPSFVAQEQITLGEGLIKQPFVLKDGYVDLPTAPGLGVELDEEKIAPLRYSGDWKLPYWIHEDDHSVADW
ncbi:galactonate dehydratase [Paenibacillus sp. LMG 31456]|uniref:Galactonate dehydratase n=1 Tax=Paenibacillus foliorum TaxID=2654974 RepID=A0A972H584_9BACL|nr:galactonate dehydratase [Paenibacillus foliorum]NOU96601.1 galactonate dehydratase [Paenibacillus foliorum]